MFPALPSPPGRAGGAVGAERLSILLGTSPGVVPERPAGGGASSQYRCGFVPA